MKSVKLNCFTLLWLWPKKCSQTVTTAPLSCAYLFCLKKIITEEFRSEGTSGAHPVQPPPEAGSASRPVTHLSPECHRSDHSPAKRWITHPRDLCHLPVNVEQRHCSLNYSQQDKLCYSEAGKAQICSLSLWKRARVKISDDSNYFEEADIILCESGHSHFSLLDFTYRRELPKLQPLQVGCTEELSGSKAWRRPGEPPRKASAPPEGSVFGVFQRSQQPSRKVQQITDLQLRKEHRKHSPRL